MRSSAALVVVLLSLHRVLLLLSSQGTAVTGPENKFMIYFPYDRKSNMLNNFQAYSHGSEWQYHSSVHSRANIHRLHNQPYS